MDVLWREGGGLYFEPILGTLNISREENKCLLMHIVKENCIRGVQSVAESWFSFHSDSYCCQPNLHPVNTELEYKHLLHYHALEDKLLLNVLSANIASRTVCTLIWNSNFSLPSWIYDKK